MNELVESEVNFIAVSEDDLRLIPLATHFPEWQFIFKNKIEEN